VQSFLTDRTQQFAYSLSSVQSVLFGVPQGSVLGPLLYVLYTAELALIVDRHGLSLHQYADDTQVYISTQFVHSKQDALGYLTVKIAGFYPILVKNSVNKSVTES